MTNGPNFNSSPSAEAIATVVARTLANSLEGWQTAIIESLNAPDPTEVDQPVGPVTPGQQRTYLVDLTFEVWQLRAILAMPQEERVLMSDLDAVLAELKFPPQRAARVFSELRDMGMVVRAMVSGNVVYQLTSIGAQVQTDMLEDGVADELRGAVGLFRVL